MKFQMYQNFGADLIAYINLICLRIAIGEERPNGAYCLKALIGNFSFHKNIKYEYISF